MPVMPIVGVVLAVAMIIGIVTLSYCMIRCCRRHRVKTPKDNLENQPYSLGVNEDSLSGRRKSKSGVPLLKDVFTQTEGSPIPSRQLAVVRADSVKTVPVQSKPPRNGSTKSMSASCSVGRDRLNGCSVTPPDCMKHKSRIKSPILEDICGFCDVTEGLQASRIDAAKALSGCHVQSPESLRGMGQFEENKRDSEYDNCWLDDAKDGCSKDKHKRRDKTFNQATSIAGTQKSRTSDFIDDKPC